MATLLDTLNTTREEQISKHYGAATAELKDKIESEPLKTQFSIYSGCVSKEITSEIAHRFNIGGLKAVINKTGIVSTQYYLTVNVSLPENLVHPVEEKEENVEKKEEEKE
jgi:hypothetical protein